jgi:hypothetical protein
MLVEEERKMRRTLKFLMISLASIAFATIGQAATLTCPDVTKCNGNLYGVTTTSLGSNQFSIVVTVDTTNYTGLSNATDYAGIGAIGIKSFTNSTTWDFVTPVGFSTTGGKASNSSITWVLTESEVKANGDGCGDTDASGTSRLCADNTAPFQFQKGNQLTFTFFVQLPSGGQINNTLHLKYLFLEKNVDRDEEAKGNEYIDDWNKFGSLGSFDIGNDGGTGTSENPVPEPSTYALLGGSLIALGFLRRR